MNIQTVSSLLGHLFLLRPFSYPIVHKICVYAAEHIKLFINMGNGALGLKQIVLDGKGHTFSRKVASSPNILEKAYQILLLSQSHTREFFTTEGLFLLGSGAFGVAEALCDIGLFAALSQGLFALGSIIALRYYVSRYQKAPNEFDKKSALFGILSALAYIIQIGLWFMGGPATIIMILGVMALAFLTVKMIIDIIQFLKKTGSLDS